MKRPAFLVGLGLCLWSWPWLLTQDSESYGRELQESGMSRSNGTNLWHHPIPSLVDGLQCKGHWKTVPAKVVLTVLISLGTYATLAGAIWLAMYLQSQVHQPRNDWGARCLTFVLPAFIGLPVGVLTSGPAARLSRESLRVAVPQHWREVATCHMDWVAPPADAVPVGCGIGLSQADQQQRFAYYLSLMILLTLAAGSIGCALTLLGRGIRKMLRWAQSNIDSMTASRTISRMAYVYVPLQNRLEDGGNWFVTLHAISFHALCATMSGWAATSDRLNIQKGLCWELWLMWIALMLASSLIQATYFTVVLPREAQVPQFGLEVIAPILPILGEPLDCLKDWLFVGVAFSKRTWISVSLALVGIGILCGSNTYMLRMHPQDLVAGLLPVRAAALAVWRGQRRDSRLAKLTSPAKLAIAVTEDLPQAGLQSIFVMIYGGSSMQHCFIVISFLKALACLLLRAAIMEKEGRFADSYQALEVYYRFKSAIGSFFLGNGSPFHLEAQSNLAHSLSDLGRHSEALNVYTEVLAAQEQALGPLNPDTLKTQGRLAYSLNNLRCYSEALKVYREVLPAMQQVLGPTHADTLRTQRNLAISLSNLGRDAEALDMYREVLPAMQEAPALGPSNPDTLKTQGHLANSLSNLGRDSEALKVYREVLATKRQALGPTHPETLKTQRKLANSLSKLCRDSEALDVYTDVLPAMQQVLGPTHDDTLKTQRDLANSLSNLLTSLGHHAEADALRRQPT